MCGLNGRCLVLGLSCLYFHGNGLGKSRWPKLVGKKNEATPIVDEDLAK